MASLRTIKGSKALIPVRQQPEPADFQAKVRDPGEAFLRIKPRPTSQEFKTAAYWREILPDLKARYGAVCAYSSLWIPSFGSVDHYLPKSQYPRSAYEWSNYRLALERVNNNKGESPIVLDPFTIQLGWFILDFATLWVRPSPGTNATLRQRVQRSIDILGLNDDDQLVNMRFEVYQSYLDEKLSLIDLDAKYPFLASEIRRQGIKTTAEQKRAAAASPDQGEEE